jgi:hypothetical protein
MPKLRGIKAEIKCKLAESCAFDQCDGKKRRLSAKMLSKDEAGRIAANFCKAGGAPSSSLIAIGR